jgi:hypothetical protein
MPIAESNKPGLAAVLSLIVPGVGQFYNGTFWRGIFWLIITPGLWIGSGGMPATSSRLLQLHHPRRFAPPPLAGET